MAAIDLICSIQEKNKMILSGILEKAVNICASRGVCSLHLYLSVPKYQHTVLFLENITLAVHISVFHQAIYKSSEAEFKFSV